MDRKERAIAAVEALKKVYPDALCSLSYEKPYELLISTRLSAQCTDKRVNIVTRELYAKYPTLQAIADAPLEEIEEIIRPCGLFHTKARDIKGLAEKLIREYGGELPDTMEGLTSLPGIGRKTANLVLGDVFRKALHCHRYPLYPYLRAAGTVGRKRPRIRWNSSSGRSSRRMRAALSATAWCISGGTSAPRVKPGVINVR